MKNVLIFFTVLFCTYLPIHTIDFHALVTPLYYDATHNELYGLFTTIQDPFGPQIAPFHILSSEYHAKISDQDELIKIIKQKTGNLYDLSRSPFIVLSIRGGVKWYIYRVDKKISETELAKKTTTPQENFVWLPIDFQSGLGMKRMFGLAAGFNEDLDKIKEFIFGKQPVQPIAEKQPAPGRGIAQEEIRELQTLQKNYLRAFNVEIPELIRAMQEEQTTINEIHNQNVSQNLLAMYKTLLIDALAQLADRTEKWKDYINEQLKKDTKEFVIQGKQLHNLATMSIEDFKGLSKDIREKILLTLTAAHDDLLHRARDAADNRLNFQIKYFTNELKSAQNNDALKNLASVFPFDLPGEDILGKIEIALPAPLIRALAEQSSIIPPSPMVIEKVRAEIEPLPIAAELTQPSVPLRQPDGFILSLQQLYTMLQTLEQSF